MEANDQRGLEIVMSITRQMPDAKLSSAKENTAIATPAAPRKLRVCYLECCSGTLAFAYALDTITMETT